MFYQESSTKAEQIPLSRLIPNDRALTSNRERVREVFEDIGQHGLVQDYWNPFGSILQLAQDNDMLADPDLGYMKRLADRISSLPSYTQHIESMLSIRGCEDKSILSEILNKNTTIDIKIFDRVIDQIKKLDIRATDDPYSESFTCKQAALQMWICLVGEALHGYTNWQRRNSGVSFFGSAVAERGRIHLGQWDSMHNEIIRIAA